MNDISLYGLLREKAKKLKTKNSVMYIEYFKTIERYTYNDVYKLVNKYIEFFLKGNFKNKPIYVIVDNSVNSIAVFIAMLEVGIIPILINEENLNYYTNYSVNSEFYNVKKNTIDYFDATKYSLSDTAKVICLFEKYINLLKENNEIYFRNIKSDNEKKFFIHTSGSASNNPKMILIYEKELLKNKGYSLLSMKSEYFYTYIPISSISSITFNLLIPFYLNKQVILSKYFELEIINEKKISFLIPRNILDILTEIKNKVLEIDFSNACELYLSGEVNNLEIIKEIRKKIPSLRENVFVNLYGSTETLGIISTCNEEYLKSIYINQLALSNGDFIYTFDKMNFYKRKFTDNSYYDERINLEYNDLFYFECLPVSERMVNDVEVKNNFGEVFVNNIATGDIGIYISEKLYIICRTSDIVTINNKLYCLTALENLFFNLIGLKTAAIKYDNQIYIIVNFSFDEKSITNVKDIIPVIKKCYEFKNTLSFVPLANPIFLDSKKFPKSSAMKKTVKHSLISIIENRDKNCHFVNNYESSFLNKVKLLISNITNKNMDNVEYMGNNNFKIKKDKNFDIKHLLLFLNHIDVTNLSEDEKYFYITVNDGIIIDYIIKENWENDYIEHLFNIYEKSRDEFYALFNKINDENNNNNYLIIIGKKVISDDKIKFTPFLIGCEKNIKIDDYDYSVYDYVIIYPYGREKMNPYFFPTYALANEKIKYFKKYLNHEYSINQYEEFFIDGEKVNNKRHIMFKKLLYILRFQNCFFNDLIITKFDIPLSNNEMIIILNDKYCNKYKWAKISISYDFSILQCNTNKEKNIYYSIEKQLNDLIKSLYVDDDNNPILIVADLKEYIIKNDNSESLYELTKKAKLNNFITLIELLKKHFKISAKKDNNEIDIDFSKLKIVYMILDEELYNNPTIDKCIELGYPEEIINRIDRVVNFYDLFKEHKNNKVKRKELK